jgi:hypothetical protein
MQKGDERVRGDEKVRGDERVSGEYEFRMLLKL